MAISGSIPLYLNLYLNLYLKVNIKSDFGGSKILDLCLLRAGAAATLRTCTYPPYVGVTVPIGAILGRAARLLQKENQKKLPMAILY